MEERSSTVDRKLVTALVLIAAGFLLMLDTFDIIEFSLWHYIMNWKTFLIVIGLILAVAPERRITGFILMGLGVVFWIPSLFDVNIRLHQVFWPGMLIAIGLIIISRRRRGPATTRIRNEDGSIATDYINDIAVFGGGVLRIDSQDFKGGTLTAIFGGREINLKAAQMTDDGCVIDVFTMFGGTKLIVPDDWQVKTDAISLFGGVSDKRPFKPEEVSKNKVLLLNGMILFGGVEIKSY
jgi:predicted membrane protein